MFLLTPWFLVGALAVAAPLVAHLRRLSVEKRVAFSAVDFLEPKPPRTARRRWEDVALLIARIAVLAFLCVAFSRPYFRAGAGMDSSGGAQARVTLLLDVSASMRRGEGMENLRRLAAQIFEKVAERDECEVWVFDRTAKVVLSNEAWNQTPISDRTALVRDVLAGIVPGWRATRLDEALRAIADQQSALPDFIRKEVWVVSDFQEGSSLTGLRGISWPKNMRVHPVLVEMPQTDPSQRLSLHWLPPDPHTGAADAPWKFQIQADAEFSGDKVGLHVEASPAIDWTAPVSAGKVRTTSAPVVGGSAALVRLPGIDTFGRSVWVARPPEKRALVAVHGGGDATDRAGARYFLERGLTALGASRVESVSMETIPVEKDGEVSLWVNLGGALPGWAARARPALERGAVALCILADREDAAALESLTGESLKASEASVDGFALLGALERRHPVFAAFRTPSFSDFSAIRFWRYRRLELAEGSRAEVLARFEGGAPAVLEYGLGKGRVLVWASGWRPADGQWVLSSRAVPFLSGCLDWAMGGRQPFVVTVPGESVVLPEGTSGVRNSGGDWIDARDGRVILEVPGVYVMEPGGGVVVVNMAREESVVAPLPLERLSALGVPVATESIGLSEGESKAPWDASAALLAQELEARQGLWRWVLIGVMVLLGIETVWAGRLSQKRNVT